MRPLNKIFLIYTLLTLFLCQGSLALEVTLLQGRIVGDKLQNSQQYLNIPFATPPVGSLRWRAPIPPPLKSKSIINRPQEVIRCSQVGNYFSGGGGDELGKAIGSEDCLYLNVWTPSTHSKKPRPVFFWIHGGSNRYGYAGDELYNGAQLSERLDAIIVTTNYRLGVLGTFYNEIFNNRPALDQSGNFLTLDILQALTWVQKNIKHFGGDPSNITLAGQSAGCMNAWGVLLSPLGSGKFKRMFCSSGFPNSYPRLIAHNTTEAFIKEALVLKKRAKNIKDAELQLQNLSNHEVISFLYSLSTKEILSIAPSSVPIQHVADGTVFSKYGLAKSLLGRINNQIDLMIGTTENEGRYFLAPFFNPIPPHEYWDIINYKAHPKPITQFTQSEEYNNFKNKSGSMTTVLNQLVDSVLRLNQSPNSRIYRFRFNWSPLLEPWQSYYGATHGIDLPFLFSKFHFKNEHFLKFAEKDLKKKSSKRLSVDFLSYLKGFVHYGDPNRLKQDHTPIWKPWWPLFLKPTNLVFSQNQITHKNHYFNPLTGIDLLNITDLLYEYWQQKDTPPAKNLKNL